MGALLCSKEHRLKILEYAERNPNALFPDHQGIVKVEEEYMLDIVKYILKMISAVPDPIVLTAVCRFTVDFLDYVQEDFAVLNKNLKGSECEEKVKENVARFEPYFVLMANMSALFPYLGNDKFFDLVRSTRKYQTVRYKNQVVVPEEPVQWFEKRIAAKSKDQIMKVMSSLEDEYVSNLFVAIIDLMRFVCQHALSNELLEDVAEQLDEQGREDALFNCLALPDDIVRLAVVRCLFHVPLNQF